MNFPLLAGLAAAGFLLPAFAQAPAVVQPNPVILPTEAPPAVDPAKLAPPPETRPTRAAKVRSGKAAERAAKKSAGPAGKSAKRKLRR